MATMLYWGECVCPFQVEKETDGWTEWEVRLCDVRGFVQQEDSEEN